MATFSEIIELIQRINDQLDQVENRATDGLLLARTILDRFPNNKSKSCSESSREFIMTEINTNELNKQELQEILELAQEVQEKAKEMCELITNNTKKWRLRVQAKKATSNP